jgi:hypothetical protein
METTRFPLQSSKPLIRGLLTRKKRAEAIFQLCATSSASVRGPDFANLPASGNPVTKPHSFPYIEAETVIAKLPYAHKRNSAHPWFAYVALFDNPVKSISNTFLVQSSSYWQLLILTTKLFIIIVKSIKGNNFFSNFEQFLAGIALKHPYGRKNNESPYKNASLAINNLLSGPNTL